MIKKVKLNPFFHVKKEANLILVKWDNEDDYQDYYCPCGSGSEGCNCNQID